jgi:hypothetical protein
MLSWMPFLIALKCFFSPREALGCVGASVVRCPHFFRMRYSIGFGAQPNAVFAVVYSAIRHALVLVKLFGRLDFMAFAALFNWAHSRLPLHR